MDIVDAIEKRKSIRKFQNKMLLRETIERLLELATKAPSGKNRQPWRFVAVQNNKKNELVNIMKDSVNMHRLQNKPIGSLEGSINAISESSAVILVFNPFSKSEEDYNHKRLLTDTQSIGAAIQNMILAGESFGIGSLWICDIFYCDKEISSWLNREDELVAAVAIGYPDQVPYPRPRKPVMEITKWLE